MIPGYGNVLSMALELFVQQTVAYYEYTGRDENIIGQYDSDYADPVNIMGSFQPVPRELYEKYGLYLQKIYYTFYTPNNVKDVKRDVSGDQIVFEGRRYQVESSNDWFSQDGWVGVLCVDIGPSS